MDAVAEGPALRAGRPDPRSRRSERHLAVVGPCQNLIDAKAAFSENAMWKRPVSLWKEKQSRCERQRKPEVWIHCVPFTLILQPGFESSPNALKLSIFSLHQVRIIFGDGDPLPSLVDRK